MSIKYNKMESTAPGLIVRTYYYNVRTIECYTHIMYYYDSQHCENYCISDKKLGQRSAQVTRT